jgi:citrate lyase subunit beta/citryl-CoA lyase
MELPHLRSLLFAPGSDARKLEKAFGSAADGVVSDLEDAVAPSGKERAREVLAAAIAVASLPAEAVSVPHPGRGVVPPPTRQSVTTKPRPDGDDSVPMSAQPPVPARFVRVNASGTAWFEDDLALTRALALDGIVLPKASPEAVDALGTDGPPVIAIVETAMGLRQAFEIASKPRVAALTLGAVDLGAEVGLETRPDGQEILYARSKLTFDSAAAGICGPIDVVHLDFGDTSGLEEQSRLARALGFRGKACIHPAQIETINRIFSPSEQEVEWARSVIDAFEIQSEGVLAVNGTMVDKPVVDRARRVLREAGR